MRQKWEKRTFIVVPNVEVVTLRPLCFHLYDSDIPVIPFVRHMFTRRNFQMYKVQMTSYAGTP